MNKYLSYALLICAIAANTVNCYGPRPAPVAPVVPVVPVAPQYADGASSAAASSAIAGPSAQVITGPTQVYTQPAVGPAYGPGPAVSAYGPGPAPAVSAYGPGPAPAVSAYGPGPLPISLPALSSYGAPGPVQGPIQTSKYIVLPAGVAQINPGPINYKIYNSPPEYSTVVLPVRPRGPAVKLFLPQQQSYQANLGPTY